MYLTVPSQIAQIRVEVNQLRDKLDQCVEKQDFNQASDVKARITELEEIKQMLMDESKPQSQELRQEKVGHHDNHTESYLYSSGYHHHLEKL